MNQMGYRAMTLGNHEFDYGWRQIQKFKAVAQFPLLACNALAPNGRLIADLPYKTFIIKGVKVTVIGVVTATTLEKTLPSLNHGVRFTKELDTVKRYAHNLRQKSDILILLSHIGIKNDKILARKIPDLNLIIGGDSHTLLTEALKIKNTYIFQAHEYGKRIGHIKLRYNRTLKKIISLNWLLVKPKQMPTPDPKVQRLVKKWEQKVAQIVDKKIAWSQKTYTKFDLKPFFEKVLATWGNADLGYYNLGGIRDKITPGQVTVRHLWNIEPFNNTLVKVQIKGKHIGGILKSQLQKNNTKIKAQKTYTIITNNYIAEHYQDYLGKKVIKITKTDKLVRTVLINYIKKHGLP
jgi:2',3'-cyclic-nucleotide 2'-phosphodiesterase (5'-nucleotidase family)